MLHSGKRGWKFVHEENGVVDGEERGNMLKQLSLVNQKVNFFLHFLDYDFNLPSLQMRGEIKHCWASAKNFSACADKSKTLNYSINFKDFVSSLLISNVQLQGDAIKQQNGSQKCQIVKRRGHFPSSLTQELTNKCLGALITSAVVLGAHPLYNWQEIICEPFSSCSKTFLCKEMQLKIHLYFFSLSFVSQTENFKQKLSLRFFLCFMSSTNIDSSAK